MSADRTKGPDVGTLRPQPRASETYSIVRRARLCLHPGCSRVTRETLCSKHRPRAKT
jgi:hypothetical protein